MAFVYSQPRWAQKKNKITPGPGSHSPQIFPITSRNNSSQKIQQKLKKGIAFQKQNKQQLNKQTQLFQSSPQLSPTHKTNRKSKKQNNFKTKFIHPHYSSLSKLQTYSKQSNLHLNNNFNIQLTSNNFIQISKLEPGVFQYIKEQQTANQKEQNYQDTARKVQHIRLAYERAKYRNYGPSIKPVYKQNFYIGSKDQYVNDQKNIKNKQPTNSCKTKIKNNLNNNTHNLEVQKNKKLNNDKNKQQLSVYVQQNNPYKHKQKCKKSYGKHPFSKKIFNNQSSLKQSKYQQKQTGIEEQNQNSQQVSQFIQYAVPGPGSYDIDKCKLSTTKKSMMFTETKKQRFQYQNKNIKQNQQLFFYQQKPSTSKGKSRASQRVVGFGRSLKKTYENEKRQSLPQFYQNFQSIQNNCVKIKLKDALSPGCFTFKAPRFVQTAQKLNRSHLKTANDQQKYLQKIKNQLTQKKPTHPFISGVRRQPSTQNITSNINFSGQHHKTIQKDLIQLMSQPKYYQIDKQDQIQLNKITQLINNPNQQNKKHTKTQIQIKHQLIEDINGYRQRQNKQIRKKDIKAYTFQTNFIQNQYKQNNPDPTTYHKQHNWTKNSFNHNFIGKQFYTNQNQQKNSNSYLNAPIHNYNNRNQKLTNLSDQALKIIRI